MVVLLRGSSETHESFSGRRTSAGWHFSPRTGQGRDSATVFLLCSLCAWESGEAEGEEPIMPQVVASLPPAFLQRLVDARPAGVRDDIWGVTPFDQLACRARFRK